MTFTSNAPAPATPPGLPPPDPPPAERLSAGRRWRFAASAAIAATAALLAACLWIAIGASETSSERDRAIRRLQSAERELDRSDIELASAESNLDTIRSELSAMQHQRDDAREHAADVTQQLSTAKSESALLRGDVSRLESSNDLFESVTIDFVQSAMIAGLLLSDADGQCLADAVIDEMGAVETLTYLVDSASRSLSDRSTAFDQTIVRAASDCGVDLEANLEPGQSYGDNDVLDSLYDACAAGSGASCDELYVRSTLGSEYEQFAITCGERYTNESAPMSCVGNV